MITTFNKLHTLKKIKTVYTAGSFDLFHYGHVDYLQQIKKNFPKYKLVVGLLPDNRIKAKKGLDRPIIKQKHRLIVMNSIKYVDHAFICPIYKNGQDATFIILDKLRPRYVVFPQKKYLRIKKEFTKFGSQIVIQKRRHKTSTTEIIKRIRSKLVT